MVTNRGYKKSHIGFNPRTTSKWPTRGQDAKVLNNILTLGQNFQLYSSVKPKHDLIQLALTLGENSFILNPCFWVHGLG
jgi:hypothetical protein